MPRSIPARPKTERQLVGAALGLLGLVLLLAAGATSYARANRWVQHTLEVRQAADDWMIALLEVKTAARDLTLSGDLKLLAAYASAAQQERQKAAALRKLVVANPIQSRYVVAAEQRAQTVLQALRQVVLTVQSGQHAEAVSQLAARHESLRLGPYREQVRALRWEEDRLLVARRARADFLAKLTVLGGILLPLASSLLLGFAWRRERAHDAIVKKLAVDARKRLAALFELARALAEARTRAQVAKVIVELGMRIAGADICTLYALDEAGTTLALIGEHGVAKALVERLLHISAATGNPEAFEHMRDNTSLWAENEAEYAALFPAIAQLKVDGPRAKAFWSVPLYVEGHAVGLLAMGFYQARTFSEDDRAFVDAFAKQCAQALLRADRLAREDEKNRWFTTTLRSIGDAVIATDAEGRITFMNPVAEALTHWSDNDARGRPLEEVFCIFSEQTRTPVESPVTKVLREGKVVGLANHTLLRSRLGVEIPIDDSGAPIRNDSGRIAGVVLVFRDVSHEKRDRVQREFLAKAGAVLVSSLDYQATLATVAQLVVPTLADWCAIEVSESGALPRQVAVAHADPSKVQFARELGERYPPDPDAQSGAPNVMRTGKSELYSEIPAALLEAAARDAEHLRMMRALKLESGMVVPLRTSRGTLGAMTFVYAESGRRYGEDDLAFAEDFARRAAMAIENALVLREAEEARAQERILRGEAEIASRAKDEFLATVSHELRTPLNAILGWTVILRDKQPEAAIERGLAVIERNARAQAKLIEDVLDVSRIISGKLALNMTETNLAEAVRTAIETVTPAAQVKDITLSYEPADDDVCLVADPDRLQQIVWNLLSNAVKFTPKGGCVTVRSATEDSGVRIHVSDTGEGIRPDALPFIFEPFQQADASTTRRHGGLGLGLAIVKQLVSAHAGTVRAVSEGIGKGATFIVQLPARSVIPAVSNSSRPPAETASLLAAPRLAGLRLLAVDDETDSRAMVSEVLRACGAEVTQASSAQEALETVTRFRPDVIISDIGMPGEDGYALIRKIRALPADLGGRTPALALTAYARSEDAQRAFAAGYQKHLAKPVDPSQLATVVANLGGRSLEER